MGIKQVTNSVMFGFYTAFDPSTAPGGLVRGTILVLVLVAFVSTALSLRVRVRANGLNYLWVTGLAIVTVGGLVLRIFVSPHGFLHEFYHHSEWIVEALDNPGLQSMYGETGPAIYRLTSALFGGRETTVFATNSVMAGLTVPLTALLALALFGNGPQALFAGALMAVFPLHLRFAGSEVAVIPAVLFAVWSFFLLLEWVDRRAVSSLVGLVATTALTMQARTELLVFPILLVAFVVIARGFGAVKRVNVTHVIVAVGGLAILVLVRLFHVLSVPGIGPEYVGIIARLDTYLNPFNATRIHVFFDPEVTPPVLWLLAVAGGVYVWRAGWRRQLLALAVPAIGYFLLSSWFFSHTPYLRRTQVFCTPYWAILSAGALVSTTRMNGTVRKGLSALVLLLPLVGLWGQRDFVTTPTEAQQEWEFVKRTVPNLPPDATILAFARSAGPDMDPFPVVLLRSSGRDDIKIKDLRYVLDGREAWPDPGPNVFFYRGMYCNFAPVNGGPAPEPMARDCATVFNYYKTSPFKTDLLDGAMSSNLQYSGFNRGPWTVGYYQLIGRSSD